MGLGNGSRLLGFPRPLGTDCGRIIRVDRKRKGWSGGAVGLGNPVGVVRNSVLRSRLLEGFIDFEKAWQDGKTLSKRLLASSD